MGCQAVLDLSVFLEALEDQIHSILESSSSMDEEQCCRLLCAFHWAHRLIRLSQQPLFLEDSRPPQPNEELVTMLQLHVNWVRKWLFPELTRLLTRHPKRSAILKLTYIFYFTSNKPNLRWMQINIKILKYSVSVN